MKPTLNPRKLAILNFTKSEASLDGAEPLSHFERLQDFQQAEAPAVQVQFHAHGDMRAATAGGLAPWLRLSADTRLTLVCQRCLAPVEQEVSFLREFRFVATEAQAELEDEDSEEDVLALSSEFDLLELVEDELLMALPASPKHDVCPRAVKLRVADADFQEAEDKPNPFAALVGLKLPKG
ncbi:MAG: YceD family protein [Rhodoferax sp.]